VRQGLGLAGHSIALAARLTNWTPTDAQIWSLIEDPWQLFEPQVILLPSAPAATASLYLDGGELRYGVAAPPGLSVYLTTAGSLRAAATAGPGDRLVSLVGGALQAAQ
jgi:hypothetical protein